MPARYLPEETLALPQAQDTPPATTARQSDEDAGRKYIFRVAVRRSEDGQTGGGPQLMDIDRDVENFCRKSLHKLGTRAGPEETQTSGTGH